MNKSPLEILKKHWGHTGFIGKQGDIIQSILEKNDVLALLPTGGGKSVCYQVPALISDGICIVISPLVALIEDQVQALKAKGIKAIGITGGISQKELDIQLDNCIYGGIKFLYLSPERLLQPLVQERIQQMPVNLIAIDEAHCISEWGHDFRPAYRHCTVLRELQPEVSVIALTATATKRVVKDISVNLKFSESVIHRDSFERKNLKFSIVNKQDKNYALSELLKNIKGSAIVYARTRKETVLLSNKLNTIGIGSEFFHGGLTSVEKKEKLKSWLNNKPQVMVATNAFGMGVDKPDVEIVVHLHLPNSIENYYQEAGRAGRNGEHAKSVLIITQDDLERAKTQFLHGLPDIEFTKTLFKRLNTYFQIAYQEGENQEFFLNLNTFCARYDLPPSKSYSALKLLDQNGVISLSENSKEVNTIFLVAKKEELFKWIEQHPKMGQIVQVLLRTYGGLFEFETKINSVLLAKKSNQQQSDIHKAFQKLEKDGLAQYKVSKHDLKLTFLKPREDDKTINTIAPFINQLNTTKKDKFQSILNYAENTSTCRTNLILGHFGEKRKTPCGRCDICLQKKSNSSLNLDTKSNIIELLTTADRTSRELVDLMNIDKKNIIKSIQELLEEGTLFVKDNNEYGIKK